ncbi:TonB-dependent receptor plug domain-containing protein [Treponema pectinovorum]|uniref:TonB-dependent receptor plug domain-containing protein n=1 Tax=Treponema pectinovorum TaxID=164 RepID=UPI0011C7CAA8|nr:TonB-dependent receptor [Treponema pectinovorum]
MNKKINGIIFIILSFCAFSGFSESYSLDDVIVVSGSKIEQKIESASEKVSVVSGEDLEKQGARTVSEALRSIPGVSVTRAALKNGSASVMMQGFEGQYVKVLIDGVALSGEKGGSVYLERLPLENVDHIEVVQGSSSALFGSDAMGGVINIITKRQKTSEKKLKLGGHLSQDFASSLQSKTGLGFNVAAGKFYACANGSFDFAKGKTEKTKVGSFGYVDETKTPRSHLGFADFRLGWTDSTWKIAFDGFFSDYERKTTITGISRGNAFASNNDYSERRMQGTLSGEKDFFDSLSMKGFFGAKRYNASLNEEKIFSSTPASNANTLANEFESEIQLSWLTNSFNTAILGASGKFETEESISFKGTKRQALLSVFAQDSFDFSAGDEKLVFVVGGRIDIQPAIKDSSSLFQFTPKASIKISPFDSTTLRFSYGMGYKIPTLSQKYYVKYHSHGSSHFYIFGNKDLKPETSHGFNMTLDQKIGSNLKLSAGGFFNIHKDMIDTHKVGANYTYENLDKAITYGGTFAFAGKFDRFDFNAGYAYTKAKIWDSDSYKNLALRTPHRIYSNAYYLIPFVETRFGLEGEWNAPEFTSNKSDELSPDLLILNASVAKFFNDKKIEIYARAENFLNNAHFLKGSDGKNQKEYYKLHDGFVLRFGAKLIF